MAARRAAPASLTESGPGVRAGVADGLVAGLGSCDGAAACGEPDGTSVCGTEVVGGTTACRGDGLGALAHAATTMARVRARDARWPTTPATPPGLSLRRLVPHVVTSRRWASPSPRDGLPRPTRHASSVLCRQGTTRRSRLYRRSSQAATRNKLIGTGLDEASADAWITAWEARPPRTASTEARPTGSRLAMDHGRRNAWLIRPPDRNRRCNSSALACVLRATPLSRGRKHSGGGVVSGSENAWVRRDAWP